MLGRLMNNELVFRKCGGQIIVSVMPVTAKHPTEAQQQQRKRFSEAVAFAKAQMNDPEQKMRYTMMALEKNLSSAFKAAIAAFLANNAENLSKK
ncbi:MAG: hypothetical protein V4658_15250 [Bacteroidota bacterium]